MCAGILFGPLNNWAVENGLGAELHKGLGLLTVIHFSVLPFPFFSIKISKNSYIRWSQREMCPILKLNNLIVKPFV